MYIEEFSNQLCLDQETLQNAKLALQQFPNENEKIYVPAVVYLCCQSCQVLQLDGKTKQGNGITLTQIIRNLDAECDIEQFLMVLQDLPSLLKYHSTEFDNVVRQANFCFRLYKKFDKCFSLIEPAQLPNQTPQFTKEDDNVYIEKLKKIAWILCIIVRQNILHYEEEQESNCLISDPNTKVILILVASLSVILKNIPNTYTPNVPDISTKMLSFFCPDYTDIDEELKYYQDLSYKCINQIVNVLNHKSKVIDINQQINENFIPQLFEERSIDQSVKRLYKYYVEIRKNDDLDEECFLRQKVVFTPKKSHQQFDHNEYETLQKKPKMTADPPFMQTPLKDNKFSNTQEKSYFDIKKNPVPQTPVSKCMELHQWMKKITNQKYQCFSDPEEEQNFYEQGIQKIREYFQQTEKAIQVRQHDQEQTIMTLSLAVIDSLIQSNEGQFDFRLLNNEKFLFGILALSLYTYQIVSQKPNLLQNMKQLCAVFEISPLDLFRVIANFACFNKQMPQTIATQLFELEKYILFNLMWQVEPERVVEIFKNNNPKYFESELIRRFQNHLALRVKELCKILQLEIQDITYQVICEFLKNPKLDVLKDTTFDTVIICTFYVIQKHNKQSPAFNSYNKLYNQYYSQQKQVFFHIVEYYNDKFLNSFREIVKQVTQQTQAQQTQPLAIPRNFECQSPLINKPIPVSPNGPYRATNEPLSSTQPNFMQNLVKMIQKPKQQQQQQQQQQQYQKITDIQPFKE